MKELNPYALSGGILAIAGLRLLMAPYPNIEPIMLFVLSTALALGPLAGFTLGLGSMLISDLLLGLWGPWTLYTAPTYGFIGLIAGFLGIKNKTWNRANLTALTFLLTITYDIITATFWAFQFMIPWSAAMISQVPFTLMHLSNCVLVFLFAPSLIRSLEVLKHFSLVEYLEKRGVFA